MNLFTKVATVSLLAISITAKADTALGIILGQPTGLSFRTDTTAHTAFDAAVAWRLGAAKYLFVHADRLWFKPQVLGPHSWKADFYYGVGAIVALPEDDVSAALRLPIGLSRKFSDPDLEFFAEVAVAFTLVPDTDFDLVGGAGLRWWF